MTPAPSAASEEPEPRQPSRPSWQGVLLVLLAALGVSVGGRFVVARTFANTAESFLSRGALHDAQRWIERSEAFSANSVHGRWLRVRWLRKLGAQNEWRSAFNALEPIGDRSQQRLEQRLGALRWGDGAAVAEDELNRLVRQGADRDDAAVTLVLGLLHNNQLRRAEQVLEQWEADSPQPAQLAWASGMYWQQAEAWQRAQEYFEAALAIEPTHDLARLGLAQTLERLEDFEPAAELFAEHFRLWPQSEPALLGWARCLRRLGQVDHAAELLEQAVAGDSVSAGVWLEAAETAFFQGHYEEAIRRFEQTDLNGPQVAITIRTAATAFALANRQPESQALFDRYLAGHSLNFRRETLESRVQADPSNRKAAEELQQILAGQYVPLAQQPKPAPAVSRLFSRHCAACHGDSGAGDGPASRHLYPPARNLQADPYRLVTTENRFPSRDDIRAVIRDGIPGTSMPAFPNLSEADVEQLVEETYALRQAGFRAQLIEDFQRQDQDLNDAALDEIVARNGSEGQPIPIPTWPAVGPEQVAQGRDLFEQVACNRCHDRDGDQQGWLLLYDHRGNPTVARDLAVDPLKSGDDRRALFARLRLGMPGTPHPGSPTLTDEQLAYLVEYCLSLAKPKRQLTNFERATELNRQVLHAQQQALAERGIQ